MTSHGVSARRRKASASETTASPLVTVRRAGWVALAGGWLLVIVALASFDSADWPSHAVAVHNDPTENLCGSFGAVIAYGAYHVIGIGTWLLAAGLAGLLVLTARGTRPGHLGVRTLGLILAALSVSSFHGLLAPDLGPLAGAPSGLVATAVVGELTTRFNAVGSFLILLASLGIGAVVAADRLVFAAVRGMLSGAGRARRVRGPGNLLRALVSRPKAALALATGRRAREADEDEDDEYEYEDEYEDDPDAEYEDEDEEEYEEEDDDEPEVRAEAGASKNGKAPPETDGKRARLTAQQLREKIAKLPVSLASAVKNVAKDEDIPRTETFKGYEFPTLELLENPEHNFSEKMEAIVRRQAEQLEEALNTYGIDAEVVGIESGPAVTLYSVQLAPGTKVAKISAISSDLARALRAQNIRIVPNMVGRTAIGIEVPNLHRERVRLKELMSGGHARKMVLPMFLGKDAAGEPLVADLTRMPHMLIAGTTGSGKSVCINSILMSWLYTKRPDELKLILVDPKMVEMSQFAEIPHLMCPVVTESARAAAIMEWAVERMEERYELMREAQVRDIASYNGLDEQERYERFGAETDAERARVPNKLPYVVFVVDELADMMMTCKEVEHSIVRVAQKARAVGIHLILATQRPQANVVTGLIKSNMPCRASFKVASGMDSRIVLDSKGAELLLGQGDMMFLTPHTSEIMRSQGTLVEDSEIRRVVRFLKTVATPKFERSLISLRAGGGDDDGPGDGSVGERDSMFDQAVRVMIESGRGSVSLLQRRLSIGYGRASRLVDQMSLAGIVGDHKGSVAREVLITLEEWEQMRAMEESGADDEDGSEPIPEREDPPLIETAAGPVPAELEGEYRN